MELKELPSIDTILYASDLGEHARPAFRMAYKMAEANDARIVFLHVIEPVSQQVAFMVNSYLPESDFDEVQRAGRQRLHECMSERLQSFCDEEFGGDAKRMQRVEQRIEEGYPARTILHVADELDADLLVLGAHSHTTVGELLVGSVAHKVMHRSTRPLLLVPIHD